MPKLYVVRHAEPAVTGRLLGRADPPLSDIGRLHAQRALSVLHVEMVYTSPLRRARETAAAIDAPVRVMDELAEHALGEWDGLTWAEIEERWPEQAALKCENWFGVTPPGGEPWAGFEERVRHALREILRGPFPAAAVGHVAVNAVIDAELSGGEAGTFLQDYCGIEEYELEATD